MTNLTPERETHWWSAFKKNFRIAPPGSLDSWEPHAASPPVPQNSHENNPRRFLSIFSAAIGLVVSLIHFVLELMSHDYDNGEEETDTFEEYSNFIILHYDDFHSNDS